jgi:hypothetical protein
MPSNETCSTAWPADEDTPRLPEVQYPAKKEVSVEDSYEVTLSTEELPQSKPLLARWIATIVICIGAICAACASSAVSPPSNVHAVMSLSLPIHRLPLRKFLQL